MRRHRRADNQLQKSSLSDCQIFCMNRDRCIHHTFEHEIMPGLLKMATDMPATSCRLVWAKLQIVFRVNSLPETARSYRGITMS